MLIVCTNCNVLLNRIVSYLQSMLSNTVSSVSITTKESAVMFISDNCRRGNHCFYN